MKYKISYSRFAKDDIRNGFEWYKNINKNLAKRFLNEFKKEVAYLQEQPFSVELKYSEVRILFLKSFPFGIHFLVNENSKSIVILGVFHTSRNPDIWSER